MKIGAAPCLPRGIDFALVVPLDRQQYARLQHAFKP